MKKHIVVIGGGASGLVAAITAAREGAQVTIIEQKDRLGKKILSTGNGRCNLTNEKMDISCFHGDDTSIISEVLASFGYKDTISFFEELGVLLKNRQGYFYPISDQASTILDVLRMEIEHLNVQVLCNHTVQKIDKNKTTFLVKTDHKTLTCDAVILATGGKAAPVLGSDGSGYQLAKSFGHRLSPVVPALVQLRGKGTFFKQIAGIRTNANVRLFVDHQLIAEDTGELQLTNYGISGIPVFQISRYAAKAIYEKKDVFAEIDFIPTMTETQFSDYIKNRILLHGYKTAEDFLIGVFPKKLIGLLLKQANISCSIPFEQTSNVQRDTLLRVAKHFCITIEDTNDFTQAQVCAGGVKTTEINPHTMESLYESDLYLVGELLDIDGICGGYNLQWAWSTGYIAGKNAAKGFKE